MIEWRNPDFGMPRSNDWRYFAIFSLFNFGAGFLIGKFVWNDSLVVALSILITVISLVAATESLSENLNYHIYRLFRYLPGQLLAFGIFNNPQLGTAYLSIFGTTVFLDLFFIKYYIFWKESRPKKKIYWSEDD